MARGYCAGRTVSRCSSAETYYAIAQPDYVVALAIAPDSRVLLVGQYRPAIERFSLELPAGMLDRNEDPHTAAARELLEETGYPTETIELIGKGGNLLKSHQQHNPLAFH